MEDPTQSPDRLRLLLAGGESVELDGGTLTLDDFPAEPSIVLRMLPLRARLLAGVLADCSDVVRAVEGVDSIGEDELSRVLAATAAMLGEGEPAVRAPRGPRAVPAASRVRALAVLGERDARLSPLQRLALIDAAAWWLTDESGGSDLAYALISSACDQATAQHVFVALLEGDPS